MKRIIPFFLCIMLCFSSCSYLDFENKIKEKVDDNEQSTVESPTLDKDKQKFISIGDTFRCEENSNLVDYTVNSCTVYKNFKAYGLRRKDVTILFEKIADNSFVLINITVKNIKALEKLDLKNEPYPYMINSFNLYKKTDINNLMSADFPEQSYFKEHSLPKDDSQYFHYYLKDDETATFNVGFVMYDKTIDIKDYMLTFGIVGYEISKDGNSNFNNPKNVTFVDLAKGVQK